MSVKIRLMRIGTKKRPFYRVVAVDERKKRTGKYIELLGTYNPLTEPKEIILKKDRIEHWTSLGAVMSNGYLRIIGKAPQRVPRKPKKAVVPANRPAETQADKPITETPAEPEIIQEVPTEITEATTPETPVETEKEVS